MSKDLALLKIAAQDDGRATVAPSCSFMAPSM